MKNTTVEKYILQNFANLGDCYILKNMRIIEKHGIEKEKLKNGTAAIHSKNFCVLLRGRLMVGHQPLELGMMVRIHPSQQCAEESLAW